MLSQSSVQQVLKEPLGPDFVDFNEACGEETENVHFKPQLLVTSPAVFPHNSRAHKALNTSI